MAWTFSGILKGFLIQNEVDRSKELVITVDASATPNTRTTLVAAQTANRTITLPDGNATLVTTSSTQTLTNKTMDGDDNTFLDIGIASLKTVLADANKFIARNGSGAVVSTNLVPSGTVVGTSDAQTLTNKTIDGDNNTLQDISISSLKTDLAAASTFISRDASGVVISTKAVPNGVVVGTTDTQTLTNKVLSGNTAATLINGSGTLALNSSGTITVPNATDTLVGKTTTDILSNKSFPSVVINGSVSGTATIQAADTTTSYAVKLPSAQGSAGTVPQNDGSGNLSWQSVSTNPMTTGGDIIYGGASGTPTRLANGLLGQILSSSGGTSAPVWGTPRIRFQLFTTVGADNFVTPTNTTTNTVFKVTCVGGGGSGGTASGSVGGGGGGGGATAITYVVGVTAGTTLPLVVGAGGTAITVANTNGNNGSSSSFGSAPNCLAGGGLRGRNNAGLVLGGSGGTATTGNILFNGSAGDHGSTVSGIGNFGGIGGSSHFGGGGVSGASANGGSGTMGGGGGGGNSAADSGAGGDGFVLVEWVAVN